MLSANHWDWRRAQVRSSYREEFPVFRSGGLKRNLLTLQLSLAWLLAQGTDIVPIPATKRRKYLEENPGALSVKLDEEDLRRIADVAPKGVAAGLRYPEMMMKLVNG
jgi:aryl-alcohol dehydrogenase-like predicted oxidoreductase